MTEPPLQITADTSTDPAESTNSTDPGDHSDRLGDPVDAILLHEVAANPVSFQRVVVLDDISGALVVPLATESDQPLRVHCDLLTDEDRVRAAAAKVGAGVQVHPELTEELLAGATLVVLRLPKSLAALDEMAEAVARWAGADVRLLAGGRVKHMTPGMNRVLLRHFGDVSASLGRQKSRVLRAAHPRADVTSSYPRCERDEDLDLTVCAHGAAFAGTGVDLGSRLLASVLPQLPSDARNVVDLGCGTGVLATLVARQHPEVQVRAIDESAAACRSAAATAACNGFGDRVVVERADRLVGVPDASVDVIVCNPPFHRGTARDSDTALAMLSAAARALRPKGELWTVYNSHLPYLAALRRLVGRTTIVVQNPRYTVTRSRATAR